MVISLLIIIGILAITAAIVLNLPSFGKNPTGERLERIKKSPNYRDGKFQNLEETLQLTSEGSKFKAIFNWLFKKKNPYLAPTEKLPAVHSDLKNLPNNSLVWLGHSSYFLKIDNKTMLVDPVFHTASPFSFMVKPYVAEYNYTAQDLPEIDLLMITHDHWDHLDYQVMKEIRPQVKQVLATLGVGSHLEYWGFNPQQITELDWNEKAQLLGMQFTSLPTRHFSGRGLVATQTLWGSFMLESAGKTIYIGGDSGYGKHIADIGQRFPNIDLALIENGQFNQDWKCIHFLPEDLRKAMKELGAKRYLAGHNSKFSLAKHPWYEPMENLSKIAEQEHLAVITPKIGEIVHLDDTTQKFDAWWKKFVH